MTAYVKIWHGIVLYSIVWRTDAACGHLCRGETYYSGVRRIIAGCFVEWQRVVEFDSKWRNLPAFGDSWQRVA